MTADRAAFLSDSDIVIGLKINGDARAYPLRILVWHEILQKTRPPTETDCRQASNAIFLRWHSLRLATLLQ